MRVIELQRGKCKVLCSNYGQVIETKLSSSACTNTYRPSILRAYKKYNYVILPHAILLYLLYVPYINCTILTNERVCDITHLHLRVRRDTCNSLRHQQTRNIVKPLAPLPPAVVLNCNHGATTIYAHNHIWSDNCKGNTTQHVMLHL